MQQVSREKTMKHKRLIVVLSVISAIVAATLIGFAVYASDYYHADETAQQAISDTGAYANDGVNIEDIGGKTAFVPTNPIAGFIFYPGGKVEGSAYAPLLQDLAQRDILCVMCPMPFNLAVFNINAADGIEQKFPQVTQWYIGGHSLGGAMAASYAASHADKFDGIVLLGAYSTNDLTNTNLKALEIYGSNDKVMNRAKYAESAKNLSEAKEHVIQGGNHAQFGSYGFQQGDGDATISSPQQQEETANVIADWIKHR